MFERLLEVAGIVLRVNQKCEGRGGVPLFKNTLIICTRIYVLFCKVASCAYSPFFSPFFAYLDSNKKRKAICLLDKSQNIQGLNNFSALFTGVGWASFFGLEVAKVGPPQPNQGRRIGCTPLFKSKCRPHWQSR